MFKGDTRTRPKRSDRKLLTASLVEWNDNVHENETQVSSNTFNIGGILFYFFKYF